MLEQVNLILREMDRSERAVVLREFLRPLNGFEEAGEEFPLAELEDAIRGGRIERTPNRAQWAAAYRMLVLLTDAEDVLGVAESGIVLADEQMLNSTSGVAGDSAGILLMTVSREAPGYDEADAGSEKWTRAQSYYYAWMLDTGMAVLVYDDFSGTPCRWEFSAGEIAETTLPETIPPPEAVMAEIVAIAEERRLL